MFDKHDVHAYHSLVRPAMSNGTNPDERQPLLPPAALVSDPELPQHDEENPLVQQDDPKQTRSWWTVAWYTILTAICTFFLALFIKAFIDADDVEVCPIVKTVRIVRLIVFSSISVRL